MNVKINPENAACPLFKNDKGFWFWDETWSSAIGPYSTLEKAQSGLTGYAAYLGSGEVDKDALPDVETAQE